MNIGKICVPSEIFNKAQCIKQSKKGHHQNALQSGNDVLANIEFPISVAESSISIHERLDGSGYPRGLRGNEIALEARIIGVADVIDAMASYRPTVRLWRGCGYRGNRQYRGITYDPDVVDAC